MVKKKSHLLSFFTSEYTGNFSKHSKHQFLYKTSNNAQRSIIMLEFNKKSKNWIIQSVPKLKGNILLRVLS